MLSVLPDYVLGSLQLAVQGFGFVEVSEGFGGKSAGS
jgi:hypothetical protein